MSLQIFKSNRMEQLLDAAAEQLAIPPAGAVLTPEIIILQSRGMQRWFAIEMAQRFGIWANVAYPFPNRFVADLFKLILPGLEQGRGYQPEQMRWRLMQLLPKLLDMPEFAALRSYLQGDSPELRLYQLCGQIADLFDQYTLYRGDLLAEWQAGRGEGWQPLLWRALIAAVTGEHRETLRQQLLKKLRSSEQITALPERISLFGISTLPPFHMDIFAALSARMEVNIFILHPCQAYWGDVRRSANPQADESGNPLLASMGRLGRDFGNLLLAYDHVIGLNSDLYEPPPLNSLLMALQSDMLNLECRRADAAGLQADSSIRIHSCHSPMREVEVLHDSLLEMFERLPDLKPRDILVMTPDIDAYAPYIAAVFEAETDPARRIPFSIADRSIMSDNSCAAAFMAILSIGDSRFEAPLLLDILSVPEVAAAFALTPAELAQIRNWIEATRIRWGLDPEQRASLGLPAYKEQSWQAGIDRLLLGIAMPEEGKLFAETLPFDAMEGESVTTLGKLTGFLETLAAMAGKVTMATSHDGWRTLCNEIMATFFLERQQQDSLLPALSEAIDSACRAPAEAGFEELIPPQLFRAMLSADLDKRKKGLGFMTGGVTFCAMLPMRSIPFRVVAMLGMNDAAFPRRDRISSFDLIAAQPRPGDRSLRSEDRYLFLESLISARELLHISYVGQGERDNAIFPPSVLVSELMDYLQSGLTEEERACSPLVTRHRLQPFSSSYFSNDQRLFSYSAENYRGLQSAVARGLTLPPFCPEPLPPLAELSVISLETLIRFFRNPAAAFFATRLGIRFAEFAEEAQEREVFQLASLDNYQLKQSIARSIISGEGTDSLLPVVRASGVLPPAAMGRVAYEAAFAAARVVADRVGALLAAAPPLPPVEIDLNIAGLRLTGRLSGVRESGLIRYRCGKFGGKDAVSCWLEHLCLNAAKPSGYPLESLVISQDLAPFKLAAVPEALPLLEELVGLYLEGMRRPLHFFPQSSFEYAKSGKLAAARKQWTEGDYPESADRAYKAVFAGADPLDEKFVRLADTFFAPFQAARGKL